MAIVEQQILHKTIYDRSVLKKKVIHPLPSTNVKKTRNTKSKPELERKLLVSLVMGQMKQQQGLSMATLPGIQQDLSMTTLPGMGIAKYPPLYFNEDGFPLTNIQKSAYKNMLFKRYGENSLYYFRENPIHDKSVFIDGMPILFMAPILGMTTFKDYVQFLLKTKVTKYFSQVKEVHICFDVPDIWNFNLKLNVQAKRDSKKQPVLPLDVQEIIDSTQISNARNWNDFLGNREDKRKLVLYMGKKILDLKDTIAKDCTLIVGGCFLQNETYRVTTGSNIVLPELNCNHEEADTRMFAHAAWSKKNILQFVATDTDVLAILLLNYETFSEKTTLIEYSGNRIWNISTLIESMNQDSDTDLAVLKSVRSVTIPFFFGIIHPLIGSDILCSPRGFGPSWIIKACIDFSAYLFDEENGLQHLKEKEPSSSCLESYVRFILAVFKKRYKNRIKMTTEEILGKNVNLNEVLDSVRKDVWIYTIENNTMIPSKECLELRAQNLSFQLQIWTQATKPIINVPEPKNLGWEDAEHGLKLTPDSKNNLEDQAMLYKTIMKKCRCKKKIMPR